MRVLTTRQLNRTYLHRQLLSERVPRRAADVVGHLVALQGQEADSPYLSLWSRMAGFRHDDLTSLLHDGGVVRSALLRGTQHLSTGDDYLWLRPTLQPALERLAGRGGRLNGVDPAEFEAVARGILADGPMTRPELSRRLIERFPGHDAQSLTYVVHLRLSLLHPPPAGTWRHRGRVLCVPAEARLGRPMAAASPEALVMRYLAAFGPASVKDLQVFAGMTRLGALFAEMRPLLRVFRDENGTDLYDLPDAPIADADDPAPVVFLPEFDNAVLGHADRARIIHPGDRPIVMPGWSIVRPTVLVDGFVAATWSMKGATLTVAPFRPLGAAARAAVEEEGARLVEFVAPDAAGEAEIRWTDGSTVGADFDRSWRP
ncbi:winged helix DNA-binding domain-containing protein [Actinoplanes aureus]|uniref:AlkZ family DNA glycosylase n=1 Tax=Actinoplanes aureus TaxID=2792083 RepID=A0A931FXZ1_9ACTN|nr:winged helix DNA-binding domain-containing protein [Actinoplanes aureus]MBG0563025.1 AlkZ family DNA glycosylase [Actinoplanes aureus]